MVGVIHSLWHPLPEAFDDYINATDLLADMEEGAARFSASPTPNAEVSDDRSVRVVTTELAREMGLTITRLTPSENDGLSIWLENAEGMLVFRWLLRLRDEYGVHVQRAAIHKGDGANLTAEITLGRI